MVKSDNPILALATIQVRISLLEQELQEIDPWNAERTYMVMWELGTAYLLLNELVNQSTEVIICQEFRSKKLSCNAEHSVSI